jgi:hypothetical protein
MYAGLILYSNIVDAVDLFPELYVAIHSNTDCDYQFCVPLPHAQPFQDADVKLEHQ